jgi:Tfp pilus assembly protein PilV
MTTVLPTKRRFANRARQQGMTLILALVMLMLLSMVVMSTFNQSVGSMQIIDNSQQRAQALNAANSVAEAITSTTTFAYTPTTVLDNSNCPTAAGAPSNSTCKDIYGDEKTVVVVALVNPPTCKQVKSVDKSTLNLSNPEDAGCSMGESQNFGIAGTSSSGSLCSDSLWEVELQATEAISSTRATLTEGVSIRVSNDAVGSACP